MAIRTWCPGTGTRTDREEFIRLKLEEGVPLEGLYPTGPEWEERFQAWRTARGTVRQTPTK